MPAANLAVKLKDPRSTRQQLVDAAEAMFSARGIDSVSLVDIGREAGQKNRSAMQYHFGNKAGLINAVLDKHSIGIQQQRAAMLDELAGREHELRDVVAVLVLPVAAKLDDGDGGRHFLAINSQLMAAEHYAELRMARIDGIAADIRRLRKMTAAKMPGRAGASKSARVRSQMMLIDCMLFHGLATYLSRADRSDSQSFVDTLVDSITAVLSI